MKKHTKRILSVLLAALLVFGGSSLVYIFAAGSEITVYQVTLPRGDDPNQTGWGHEPLDFLNGWNNHANSTSFLAKAKDSYNGDAVYCIEPGVTIKTGDTLPEKNESYWDQYPQALNPTIDPDTIKVFIGRILQYGYTGKCNINWDSSNATHADQISNLLATQFLIWEVIVGERNSNFGKIDASTKGKDNILEWCATNHPLRSKIMSHYNRIASAVLSHGAIPSFMANSSATASTQQLTWNGSKYTLTLTDSNNVVGNYTFSASNPAVSCTVSGNQLVLSSNSAVSGTVTITANKSAQRRAFVVWADDKIGPNVSNQLQDVMTYGTSVSDPVNAFLKLTAVPAEGDLTILKSVSGGGSPAGFQFEVRKGSDLVGTYTTDANGKIQIPNLIPGTYTVKEVNLPADYVAPTENPKTVTIAEGQSVTLNWENTKKQGVITIQKRNAAPDLGDYSLAGAVFEIRSGGTLMDTVTTGADGKAQSKPLPLGSYTVTEKTAPTGYLRNTQTFNVTISGNQGSAAVVYAPEVVVPQQPQMGKINIRKSNNNPAMGDYDLAGAVFDVYSGSTVVDTLTTDANGEAQSKALKLGNYTVKERTAPYGFTVNKLTFTANLTYAGQDADYAYVTVNCPERPQTGIIRLTKTNVNPAMGNYSLAYAMFEVRNSAGTLVDTIATNTQGKAQTKELPLGAYTVTEKTAPYGFVRNKNTFNVSLVYAGQDVEITYGDVAVGERPQTGRITVTKRDVTTGATAQGDATLNGAVFEILASDEKTVMDTLYCGAADKATSKELPLGTYYIKEKIPPVGYTLDTAAHKIVIAYGDQDIEVLMLDGTVRNKVIEGQIALVKHTDQPMEGYDDPQIEQPLKGAVFEIFLKSSASYAKAKETERDRLTTNENGYAISKKLPYGVYTIHEIEAPGEVKLVAPFDVFISQEGHIYRFILNDPTYTARVKIVKLDASTDKVIPAAGTSFKIKDLKTGSWIKQAVWYPTPAEIDVFETAPDGSLVLPEPLLSGEYELHEVQAPYGYLLSETPVKFTISSAQTSSELAEALVTVTMHNQPVKGNIIVEKQGEMLTGTTEVDTQFGKLMMPVFEMRPLIGAEFDIIAAEDIVTPDGTVRAKQGDVVDHIVTGNEGTAKSKDLFLGNYRAVETKAPAGFVLDETPYPVSLVYEDQLTAIVTSQIGVDNVRQKAEIELLKVMEKPIGASDDYSAFHDVTFGLFAGENFGDIIPKDALIALITINENGKGVFSGDLPFGKFYVKELQTNPFYQLNGTVFAIDVPYAGQDVDVTKVQVNNFGAIPNELKQGRIAVEKKGEMFVGATKTENGYTPNYELRGLSGATFDIIAAEDIYDVYGKLITKKGTVVETITTGENGRAESNFLRLGRYKLVETAAPAGFILDPERHEVVLGFDGHVEEVVTKQIAVLNERYRAEIQIKKVWETPADAPKDFAPWKDITFGLYAKVDILSADGSVAIPAGALIETIAIDKDGSGKAATDLPIGSYYIQELTTANGYVLDEKQHDVVFGAAGEAVTVLSLSAENKIQRGSLRIIKTFEGKTTPVEGVPFLIVGQTAFGEVRIEAKTGKDGVILLDGLPVGKYTVTEQKADITSSYILAPAQTVTITADKETLLKINNQLAKGEIRVLKIDKETSKPLAGAMFGLYKDGKLIAEAKSGKDGYAIFKDVAFGEYEVKEISAPVGYMRSEEVLKASVGKDGSVVLFKVTNERIPGEPVQPEDPEVPVMPSAPLPNTGDSKIVLILALIALIISGSTVLFLYKRGKNGEEETTVEEEPAEKE